jgi:hypothetical protein
MVTATIVDRMLQLELSPLHTVLAFRKSLTISIDAIKSVERDPERVRKGPEGTRSNPGTDIPHLLHAGTYTSGVRRAFWDVHNPANAIVIKLRQGLLAGAVDGLDEVVVEVVEPDQVVAAIQAAMRDTSPR